MVIFVHLANQHSFSPTLTVGHHCKITLNLLVTLFRQVHGNSIKLLPHAPSISPLGLGHVQVLGDSRNPIKTYLEVAHRLVSKPALICR